MPWFEDWPVEFRRRYQAALERGRVSGEERYTSYIQAKTIFAPMFPKLQRVVKNISQTRNLRPRESLQLCVADYLGNAHQSISGLTRLLNISRAEATWLCTSGALSGARQISSQAFVAPTEAVLDMMVDFSETEDWEAAADRRGISHRAMKQVLRIGLIPAISLGDYGASRVWPRSWDDFCDLLLSKSLALPEQLAPAAIRLEIAIAASGAISPDPSRTAFLLAEIANGAVAVYAKRSRPRKLNELLISLPQLKKVVPRHGERNSSATSDPFAG